MIYSVVIKLWNGEVKRWDGLTEQQADCIYETGKQNSKSFAVSLIERELE